MNLENLNVQELNTNEMKSTNGGFIFLIAVGVGLLLLSGCKASEPVFNDHGR